MSSTPTLLDACYRDDPDLLPADEALRRIERHVTPMVERERVALHDALGRILAEDEVAAHDVPAHTNSAVDGYAFAASSLDERGVAVLSVCGSALAGAPFDAPVPSGACVRVMTGAVMPTDTDTVVMLEQVAEHESRVRIEGPLRRGQNVRHAGEDLRAGAVMLARGKRLMPAELGMLASAGRGEVAVLRRPRVAFFSTGDELRPVGSALSAGEVHDSNRYTLHAMLSRLPLEVRTLGLVRDDRDALRAALGEAARWADAVITTGGVSAGDADHVRELLGELGRVGFWKVAVRPGRPLAFGKLGDSLFFGLPGNPVAVMVTFYQFVQPALYRLAGRVEAHPLPLLEARCPERLRKKPGRVEYYRAVLSRDGEGRLEVRPTGKTGSGLLHTMSDANCLIVLPEPAGTIEPGTIVQVQPFFGLL